MKNNHWLYIALAFLAGFLTFYICDSVSSAKRFRVSYEDWQKLNFILSQAENNYVDSIDKKTVTDAAVRAALQSLDPHSVYLEPRDLKVAEDELAGGFEGVGLMFNVPNDTAVVLDVIPGGPSEKAGILKGDRILKVNEIVIAGAKVSQDSMVSLMRGPKGTKVTLTMGRGKETIPFDIVRDKIPERCVDAVFMIDKSTGYLRLSKFNRNTYQECHDAVAGLLSKGMTKLIFDVRGNTGGYLDQVCLLANDYLPNKAMIVYTEGLHRKREEVRADGSGSFQNLDISVLIDDGSASASEIFAGAIQDNDRGVVVGRRSFGKGLVQEPIYFSDGSGIRLTVARFYTPSGRCIQKPYGKGGEDYMMDYYHRYLAGELTSADSIKVDSSKVYKTVKGRTVYGGGGIIPDIFVPLDTTRATKFHIECNNKAALMRFSTVFMDRHRDKLLKISDFGQLEPFFAGTDMEHAFLEYAASLGFKPAPGEWNECRQYILPQLKGLIGRYSKIGEEVYYRYVLPEDDVVSEAMKHPNISQSK